VPLRRIDDVLTEAEIKTIDLLSLDTEGSELEIWGTFDYRKWNPRIVIVEFYTSGLPQPDSSAAVRETFAACGYHEIHSTPGNLIWECVVKGM
jgi:hypothetical protein